jgi:hypothetical protein
MFSDREYDFLLALVDTVFFLSLSWNLVLNLMQCSIMTSKVFLNTISLRVLELTKWYPDAHDCCFVYWIAVPMGFV